MTFAVIAAAVCAILLSASVLTTALKLGSGLLAWWVVIAFQILLTICGTAFAIAVSSFMVGSSLSVVGKRLAKLSHEHREAISKLQKRTPTFLVVAALVTQLVMVFADKAFGDDVLTVVTVTILLIILFWFGNEFMLRESVSGRIVGWCFWSAGVLFLPVAIMLHRHLDFVGLWHEFYKMPIRSQIALGLGSIVTVAAPFVFKR